MNEEKIAAVEAAMKKALEPVQVARRKVSTQLQVQLKEIEEDRLDQQRADALEAESLELSDQAEAIIARFQAEIERLENEQQTGSGSTKPLNLHHRLEKSVEENKRFRLPAKRQGRAARTAFEGGDASDCLRFGHDELEEIRDIEFDSRYRTALAGGKAKVPVFDLDGNPVMIPKGVRSVSAYLHEFDERGRLKLPSDPVTRSLVLETFEMGGDGRLRQKAVMPVGSKGVGQLFAVPQPSKHAKIVNCGFEPREDGRSDRMFYGTKWHNRLYNALSLTYEDCDFTECKQEHDAYGGIGGDMLAFNTTFHRTAGNNFYNANRTKPYGQYLGPDNFPVQSFMKFGVVGCDAVDVGLGAWSGYAFTGFDIGSKEHGGLFIIDDTTLVSAWEFERGSGSNTRYPIGSNQTYQPRRSGGLFMCNPNHLVGAAMEGRCPTSMGLVRGSLMDVTQCHQDVGHFRSVENVYIEDMAFAFRGIHSRPVITIDSHFAPGSPKAGKGMVGSGTVTVRGNANTGVQGRVDIWHPDSTRTTLPLAFEDEIQIDCRTKQVLYQGKRRGDYAGMLR